jgi:hypothetical protein
MVALLPHGVQDDLSAKRNTLQHTPAGTGSHGKLHSEDVCMYGGGGGEAEAHVHHNQDACATRQMESSTRDPPRGGPHIPMEPVSVSNIAYTLFQEVFDRVRSEQGLELNKLPHLNRCGSLCFRVRPTKAPRLAASVWGVRLPCSAVHCSKVCNSGEQFRVTGLVNIGMPLLPTYWWLKLTGKTATRSGTAQPAQHNQHSTVHGTLHTAHHTPSTIHRT